jgi:hypothetical protein
LLLASELLINPLLNSIVKLKLAANVNDRNYHLRIKKLDYNLFTNSLSAQNIFYTWNDTSAVSIDSSVIFIPESHFKRISLFGLLFDSRLNLSELHLINPECRLFTLKKSENENIYSKKNNNDSISSIYKSIYKLFPDRIKPFKINRVEVLNGSFIKTGEHKKTLISISSFSTAIKDFSIRSLERSDSLTLMFCEDLRLEINDAELMFPKYKCLVKSINFSSLDSVLNLKALLFQPLLPDSVFFDGDKYRDDRWKIKVRELKCEGIDLSKYIWHKIIDVQNISLNFQYLDILTNMRLDIPPGFDPEMPNEIIDRIPIDLNIRDINLNADSIIVREFWPHSRIPSRLPFTKVKARLYNISSLEDYQTNKSPMLIHASALLADAGLLNIKMKLPLLSKGTDFFYSGSLGTMPTDPLNDHLIISDLTEVASGKIDSVIFNADAENGIITAYAVPYYKDLTIKSINENTLRSSRLIAAMESFLGNVIKVNNENSKESGEIRSGRIIYRQKKTDVFLDVVWGSLKSALGKVVGF